MPLTPQHALVVEDIAETRAWLSDLLREVFPGIVVHQAAVLQQARKLIAGHRFDLALIDIQLPDGSGIDLLGEMRAHTPETYCVISTIFDDDRHLFDALRAGAQGYLLKHQDDGQIARHLRGILDDQPPLSPMIARRVLQFFRTPVAAAEDELTARESEVLVLIARGLRLREVAETLQISRHTVGDHVKTIYRKLQVNSRAEATLQAARRGLIE
jgi:DNA-binding NarL/FixJ family response regulator